MPTCFVYGTLTDPDRVAALLDGGWTFVGPARVAGLHVVRGEYPTLAPGGEADGRLLRVDDDALATLDRYEGVPDGRYVRVSLCRSDGDAVETYVGDPAALGVADGWPGRGPFAERVRAYLRDADVVVEPTG
ncbi:MAG: gamma-glutamylcyclotransferase [Haloferacaceae archaeon]